MIPERYSSFEDVATVGAVNFRSIPGDKLANLEKIEPNVREPASQGVDIVVSPKEAWVGCGTSELIASEFRKLVHGA